MTVYNVGADHSGKGDEACINAVCEALENAGHTANNIGVTPNLESRLNTGNKDHIGVFIVNGICLGTIVSVAKMVKGGGCGHVYFGIPKPIMSEPFNHEENLTNEHKKLGIAHDDTFSPSDVRAMSGKYTVAQLFDQYEEVSYVYGNTCDEVGQKILNGDTGSSGSTSSKKEGSIMSGWESITDLLKPLDGEAMVVVRGDTVLIKRIYPPEATKLWIYEGINVVDDSVTISDYSPEIYNTFVINWGAEYENQMELSFVKHRELFGERKTEVDAVYHVPEGEEPVWMTGEDDSEEESSSSEGGSILDWIFGNTTQSSGTLNGSPETIAQNLGTENDMSTGSEDEVNYVDVPITDEAEAYLFGLKTVGRARRKDGHQIECKVIGSKYWEVGEWCKVYLPSFNEDTTMFISKVSHESGADSEWLTSLTLVDYPPSLGSGQSNSPSTESSPIESTDTSNEPTEDEGTDENAQTDEETNQ